jgi:hypothetical protein
LTRGVEHALVDQTVNGSGTCLEPDGPLLGPGERPPNRGQFIRDPAQRLADPYLRLGGAVARGQQLPPDRVGPDLRGETLLHDGKSLLFALQLPPLILEAAEQRDRQLPSLEREAGEIVTSCQQGASHPVLQVGHPLVRQRDLRFEAVLRGADAPLEHRDDDRRCPPERAASASPSPPTVSTSRAG